MKSSLEIAQDAVLKPIEQIAEEVGLEDEEFEPYGRYKAKIDLGVLDRMSDAPNGKLVCVTGMTPTSMPSGRPTTSSRRCWTPRSCTATRCTSTR